MHGYGSIELKEGWSSETWQNYNVDEEEGLWREDHNA
jgi:hypothetical protein